VDVVPGPAVVLVEFVPTPDEAVPSVADDGPVSVASTDASLDEVHAAVSRHDAVSDSELVAVVVSSSVPESAPRADASDVTGVDVVLRSTTVFVVRVAFVPAPDISPAVEVTFVDDTPLFVAVSSPDASFDEVHSADSRHVAVSSPELVAAFVSSSVPDSVP
jgi:hypothetical protein